MKARVLVTQNCPRSCPNCCNNYPSLKKLMKPCKLEDLLKYDEIMITGGEPMLEPHRVFTVLEYLIRNNTKNPKLYLYTALYTPKLKDILQFMEGVHFTLHAPVTEEDMLGFEAFQELIKDFPGTARLYIEQGVEYPVRIIPNRWHRVEVKRWLKDGECPLPEDDLLVLE